MTTINSNKPARKKSLASGFDALAAHPLANSDESATVENNNAVSEIDICVEEQVKELTKYYVNQLVQLGHSTKNAKAELAGLELAAMADLVTNVQKDIINQLDSKYDETLTTSVTAGLLKLGVTNTEAASKLKGVSTDELIPTLVQFAAQRLSVAKELADIQVVASTPVHAVADECSALKNSAIDLLGELSQKSNDDEKRKVTASVVHAFFKELEPTLGADLMKKLETSAIEILEAEDVVVDASLTDAERTDVELSCAEAAELFANPVPKVDAMAAALKVHRETIMSKSGRGLSH